jgi:hypothetical protein
MQKNNNTIKILNLPSPSTTHKLVCDYGAINLWLLSFPSFLDEKPKKLVIHFLLFAIDGMVLSSLGFHPINFHQSTMIILICSLKVVLATPDYQPNNV